jgi:hypothetical protein
VDVIFPVFSMSFRNTGHFYLRHQGFRGRDFAACIMLQYALSCGCLDWPPLPLIRISLKVDTFTHDLLGVIMKDPTFSAAQFCSESLQSALDGARSVFESLDEARTRVSNDIKKLEAYLQQDLKDEFRFPIPPKSFSEGKVIEEAIVWGPFGEGRYRLRYEVSKWEGRFDLDDDSGPLFWDPGTLERESKPLIEAKFEIRKRMYSALPQFVIAFRDHIHIDEIAPFRET